MGAADFPLAAPIALIFMVMLTANEFQGGPISLAKPISLLRTLDSRADEF